MDLGSIAGMFDPPYGAVVKELILVMIGTPLVASSDFGFNPYA